MDAVDLIAHARSFLYVREAQPNRSPEIDGWLARLHRPAGESYCAAFACCMILDVDPSTNLKPEAGALHLLASNPRLVISFTEVQPGDVIVEDHGMGLGHVSIATEVVRVGGQVAGLTCIAGNTSADGKSRNGDRVAEHPHDLPDPRIAGVLRVCSTQPQAA